MTYQASAHHSEPMARKAAFGSAVGTAMEAYDFQIFGVASALVFSKIFFTNLPNSLGVILSFGMLGIGFLARPLGAIIIGHYGDRVGRRTLLIISLMGAGLCTTLIGALPSHASIGYWAPVLLVSLRLLQGIFHGGEQGGAVLMAVEHAPRRKRGWFGSWAFIGSPAGTLLASGAMTLTIATTGDDFLTWGWRIPFLISILLLVVGLLIRFSVTESPDFRAVQDAGKDAKRPLAQVVRDQWRLLLVSIGVNLGINAFAWILVSYSLAYGTEYLGATRDIMLRSTLIGAVVWMASMLFFAALSDRVGRLKVMFPGAVILVIYPFVLFAMMSTANTFMIMLAVILGFFGLGVIFGPMGAFLVELFPTKVAYSGVALGYSLGAVLGGGLAPFIASLLMKGSGGQWWTVATYLAFAGLVSLFSLRRLVTLRNREMSVDPPSHDKVVDPQTQPVP